MITLAKQLKPPAKQVHTPSAGPARQRIISETIERLDLDPAKIDPSPFQPRRDFPAEEIRDLAESIRRGQLVPIIVRPKAGGRYELLAGERRLRAIKLIPGMLIRAESRLCSDVAARSIVLTEGLKRKDWNAIEEARAFKAAIDAGDAAGPTELAQQLGLSQGQVSNRLRLLELPEKVQARIISREIPPSHARELVPFAKFPRLLDKVLKSIDEYVKHNGSIQPLDEFRVDVECDAEAVGRDISAEKWDSKSGKYLPPPKLTEEQRTKLDIITVPRVQDKPIEIAMNAKLWDKLTAAHREAYFAKADKKAEKNGNGKAAREKPPTAADRQVEKAAEAARQAERARRLAKGLWAVAIDWRRYLIAKACREDQVTLEDLFRLLIYFAVSTGWKSQGLCRGLQNLDCRKEALAELLASKGLKLPHANHYVGASILCSINDRVMTDQVLALLASFFWHDKNGPLLIIPPEDIMTITEELAIDLAKAWNAEAAGPLTERWLNLRDKEALGELARTFQRPWRGIERSHPKTDYVIAMAKVAHRQKPPAELLKPKKPKS